MTTYIEIATTKPIPRRLEDWARITIASIAICVIAVGLTSIIGWHTQHISWVQIKPSFAPMTYNAALTFILCAGAFLASALSRLMISRVFASLVFAFGSLTLLQYWLNVDLGLDQLFFNHYITVGMSNPGRMAPNAALNFVLLGAAALLIADAPKRGYHTFVIGLFGAIVFAISAAALFGYATQLEAAYGWGNIASMAIQSAICFVFLAIAILLFAFLMVGFNRALLLKWAPIPLWVGGVAATLILWQAFEKNNDKHVLQVIESQAITIKNELYYQLQPDVAKLRRMAAYWKISGMLPQRQWELDTQLLFSDLKNFQAIGWVDTNSKVRWLESKGTLGKSQNVLDMIAQAHAKILRHPRGVTEVALTPVFKTPDGTTNIGIVAPLFTGQVFEGYIVGVLGLENLLGKILKNLTSGVSLTVLQDEQQIFQRGERDDKFIQKWGMHLPLEMVGVNWEIIVWPTQQLLAQHRSVLPKIALAGGLIMSSLLALILHLFQNARARANQIELANAILTKEISERHRVLQALRESEERFRILVGGVKDYAIFLLDPNGDLVSWNAGAQRIIGYQAEEIIGQHFSRFYRRGDIQIGKPAAAIQIAAAEGRFEEEGWRVKKDGSRFWAHVLLTALRNDEGVLQGFSKITRDITEQKHAETLLKQSEARFKAVTSNIPGMVYQFLRRVDGTYVFPYVSEGSYLLCGLSAAQIIDNADTFLNLIFPDDRLSFNGSLVESANNLATWYWEGRLLLGDGTVIWVNARSTPMPLPKGHIMWHGIMFNITDKKLSELEIKQSREQLRDLSSHIQLVREEEKASIAREIHDELGGTLTALKMDIFWLAKRLPEDAQALIDKTVSMSKLVDSAVQATRRISTELRPTVLDDLGVVAAIEWQASEFENHVGITCELENRCGEITLDEAGSIVLFRIVQEALTNVARHAGASYVKIFVDQDAVNVILEITDNGRGINKERMFSRTSHGIRGMLERVQHLRGTLTVEGGAGEGTTIRVIIPRTTESNFEAIT